jgi:hypothetical protein
MTHHEGKSIHQVQGLTSVQFVDHTPRHRPRKTRWASVLTNDIFSVIEAMTLDDTDYVGQHNTAQQAALFQHENFVLMNAAAKEADTVAPSPKGTSNFSEALNNVATMASGKHIPYLLLKAEAAAPSGASPPMSPKGRARRRESFALEFSRLAFTRLELRLLRR